MFDEFGEKTEAPTLRRRAQAREEGRTARSADLTGAAALLGGVLLLAGFAPRLLGGMRLLMESMLTGDSRAGVTQHVATGARVAAEMLAPIAAGVMLIGVAAGLLQVGFLVTPKPLMPKLSRLSPIGGFAQLFSLRGVQRLGMSLAKVVVVVAVAAACVAVDLPKVLQLVQLDAARLLGGLAWLVWTVAVKVAAALLALGLADYAVQRWQHERELRMTRREVREELRRMEGDPQLRQRRAKVARQLAVQRIDLDVPRADVVVMDPTRFAVALRYDEKMSAPKLLAKGADLVAMRMQQIAAAHGVPVIERGPLAQSLCRSAEVGQEVPPQHYDAVAEIIAYVFRLSGRKTA